MKEIIPVILLPAALLVLTTAYSRAPENPRNTDWSVLGNGPNAQHHSELTGINRNNVYDLGLAWSTAIPSKNGLVGNPLIQNGVVFQGGPGGQIVATAWSMEDCFGTSLQIIPSPQVTKPWRHSWHVRPIAGWHSTKMKQSSLRAIVDW